MTFVTLVVFPAASVSSVTIFDGLLRDDQPELGCISVALLNGLRDDHSELLYGQRETAAGVDGK